MENKISLCNSDGSKSQNEKELSVSQTELTPQQNNSIEDSKCKEHGDSSDSDNRPLFHDYTSGRLIKLDNFSFGGRANHFDSHLNISLKNKHEQYGDYNESLPTGSLGKSDKNTDDNYNNENNAKTLGRYMKHIILG